MPRQLLLALLLAPLAATAAASQGREDFVSECERRFRNPALCGCIFDRIEDQASADQLRQIARSFGGAASDRAPDDALSRKIETAEEVAEACYAGA